MKLDEIIDKNYDCLTSTDQLIVQQIRRDKEFKQYTNCEKIRNIQNVIGTPNEETWNIFLCRI